MPTELQQLLRDHGARYHLLYHQDRLSDHLPMAALALHRLGATEAATLDWCQHYVQRLEPAENEYLSRRRYFLQRLEQEGVQRVLSNTLPSLISGWARDAFHPIIRLACGYDSQNLEEMAAGLAYFEQCGAEPRVDELAAMAVVEPTRKAEDLVRGVRELKISPQAANFSDKLSEVVAAAQFATAAFTLEDNLRRVSAFGLDVFASSHDFFALHLVTGAHAYRVLYDYAGEHRDAIFNLGITAGYAAAGAPPLTIRNAELTESVMDSAPDSDLLSLIDDDEHNIKLAYSAVAQGRFFNDPSYVNTARVYLQRKRHKTSD